MVTKSNIQPLVPMLVFLLSPAQSVLLLKTNSGGLYYQVERLLSPKSLEDTYDPIEFQVGASLE